MPLSIISVCQKPPQWCVSACDEYLKKLQPFTKISYIDLPLSPYHKRNDTNNAKKDEAKSILSQINSETFLVTLDEHGKQFSSQQLSRQLNQWLVQESKITFLIGGPAGLDESCIQRANVLWSLSALTLPHRMAKIILLEQLYRAYSLLNNHPYHK